MTNAEQQRQNQLDQLQILCKEQSIDVVTMQKLLHAERIKKLHKQKSGMRELIKELF